MTCQYMSPPGAGAMTAGPTMCTPHARASAGISEARRIVLL